LLLLLFGEIDGKNLSFVKIHSSVGIGLFIF